MREQEVLGRGKVKQGGREEREGASTYCLPVRHTTLPPPSHLHCLTHLCAGAVEKSVEQRNVPQLQRWSVHNIVPHYGIE